METKEFKVEVMETLVRIVTVEATSEKEAINLVMYDYHNAELVLNADDFFDVDFNLVNNDKTI